MLPSRLLSRRGARRTHEHTTTIPHRLLNRLLYTLPACIHVYGSVNLLFYYGVEPETVSLLGCRYISTVCLC